MTPSPYYTSSNLRHRWQGDLYQSKDLKQIPSNKVPYWMLVNRTCHLVEGKERQIKLDYLVFCTVLSLKDFVQQTDSQQSSKNQIKNIVYGKTEHLGFLPQAPEFGVDEPLVADFNMLYSFSLANCPTAEKKIAQLSSPFAEHMFQRFSRWFYTVGFDDTELRQPTYIQSLLKSLEQ